MSDIMQEVVEATVRHKLPVLLSMAGMESEAQEIESAGLCTRQEPAAWAALVRKVGEAASGALAEAVEEACFWAEAMVWACWAEDAETMEVAQSALSAAVESALCSLRIH